MRAHVAKICCQFRLMRGVVRALTYFVLMTDYNYEFMGLLQNPFQI